jgi:O-antigen/teichoic acid export membrane protein
MVLLGIAIITSNILSLLAKPFIFILFGSNYFSSISPLQVLAWMLIPYTINSFLSLAFLAEGDTTIIMIGLMSGIVTLAILTIWWEPLINLRGAAWAALSAEILQSIILFTRYIQRYRNALKENLAEIQA